MNNGILVGLIIAVLVSFLHNSFWLLSDNQEQLTVFSVLEQDDETFYAARLKEAMDGKVFIGQPFIKEHSNRVYTFFLPELFIATISNVFSTSLLTILLFLHIACIAIISFIIWLISYRLTVSIYISTILQVCILFGLNLNMWQRIVSPQITFIFFLFYVLLFIANNRITFSSYCFRGILLGTMLFVHPYDLTFVLSLELTLLLYSAIFLRENSRIILKKVLLLVLPFLIAVLVSVYLSHTDEYHIRSETLRRLGLLSTHLPSLPRWQLYLCLAAISLAYVRYTKKIVGHQFITILCFISAGFLVLNQSILTGKELEFASHYSRNLVVVLPIVFLTLYTLVLKNFYTVRYIGAAIIFVIIVIQYSIPAWNANEQSYQRIEYNSALEHSEEMLKVLQQLPPEQVILTTKVWSRMLPILTNHYPFFSTYSRLQYASDLEIQDRYIVQNTLYPEQYESRSVFGTQSINSNLRKREWCSLIHLLTFNNSDCTVVIDDPDALENISKPLSMDSLSLMFSKYQLNYILLPTSYTLPSTAFTIAWQDDHWILYSKN